MSKVNLDVTERLDITCRQGDTFELTLTLKDSSGTGLTLSTDDYKFLMQVRQAATRRSVARAIPVPTGGGGESDDDTSITDGIVVGSTGSGVQGPVNFVFQDIDDSGNVTVFLSARDMRQVPAGRYKYDFQYIKGATEKTVLEGRFTVNSDVSKSI
jgi:hypothetical protein